MEFVGRLKVIAGLVVIAAVVGGLLFLPWLAAGGGAPGFPPPGPSVPQPETSNSSPPNCIQDPASLPKPPDGPDGRPSDYLHTCGSRIYDSHGREVRITGLNWFGLETGTYSPHGLWVRNWQSMLDQVVELGYNALRLPYSNEMLRPGKVPQGINYALNPDLKGLSPLEVMDRIIDGARRRGLKVVLDRHRPTSAAQSALWYTKDVPEQQWIDDWRMLAQRYMGNDTVIGFDLHNEPRDTATWGSGDPKTDWRMAAEKAGNAVLEVNPYLLIIVEGVEQYQGDWYWWGGNLQGVASHPIQLNVPGRLVYSPHDYGPEVYPQGWFSDPDFPNNLPQVWDKHWGYIQREGLAPVLLGEFGGDSVSPKDAEGKWQLALLAYIGHQNLHYFNWSLNPNSSDTGGLLTQDWLSLVQSKYQVYKAYLAPPIVDTSVQHFGPPPADPVLVYRVGEKAARTTTTSFSVQVENNGSQPIDLTRVKIRYWFSYGQAHSGRPVASIDWAALGNGQVQAKLVPVNRGSQDYYLELSFTQGTPQLSAYSATGDILVRIHASDWSQNDQTNDYSFNASAFDYQQWDHLTLYIDNKLACGREP